MTVSYSTLLDTVESDFPGGQYGWVNYLNKNMHYPAEAATRGIQGNLIVMFIVDSAGNVSNVEAISDPTEERLRKGAIRVISISGKWKPAVCNGQNVSSYKKQILQFRLATE